MPPSSEQPRALVIPFVGAGDECGRPHLQWVAMELPSIHELQKRRRKLVKLLAAPLVPLSSDEPEIAATEEELFASCRHAIEKHIAEIDTEIAERTAGTRSAT